MFGDGERGRGRRRRGVAEQNDAVADADPEVVHKPAVGFECLGADAGGARHDVVVGELGHIRAGGRDEPPLAHRPVHLPDAGAPVLAREAPERRRASDLDQVRYGDGAPGVALTGQGEHGIGSDEHFTVHAWGDVHTEERVTRVRYRVHQPVDEAAPFGLQRVVLAAERHDHRVGAVTRQFGKAVALQSAADDDVVERGLSGTVLGTRGDHHLGSGRSQADDLVAEEDLRAGGDGVGGKRLRHLGEVDDRGGGRVQGGDAAHVGFELAQLFGADDANAGNTVGERPLLDVIEPRAFDVVECDKNLAAGDPADSAFGAELLQQADTAAAEHGFDRAGLVVEARMDDPAVAPGLMRCEPVLLLEQRHLGIRPSPQDLAGDGDADDAATDNGDTMHTCIIQGRKDQRRFGRIAGQRSFPARVIGTADLPKAPCAPRVMLSGEPATTGAAYQSLVNDGQETST